MRSLSGPLLVLMAVAVLALPACKDKDPQPTSVELKLFSSGVLPAGVLIHAVDVNVDLAQGVSLATANSSTVVAPESVVASGVASGALLATNYSAPTSSTLGNIRINIISLTGFGTGEFATIKGTIAEGYSPAAENFSVHEFAAADVNGGDLTGLTAGLTADIQ
jgi:hypothetical protein